MQNPYGIFRNSGYAVQRLRYFITDIYPALEALKTDSRLYTKTAFIDEHKKGDLSLFSAAIFRFPAF